MPGRGATCTSSGHAAQLLALFPLMEPGTKLVVCCGREYYLYFNCVQSTNFNAVQASDKLYGGSITQFGKTIKKFAWDCEFVDMDDHEAVKAAVSDPSTRALFCESLVSVKSVAKVCNSHNRYEPRVCHRATGESWRVCQ